MGVLSNPKYETFARLVARGMTRTQAAQEIGVHRDRAPNEGSRLARKPHVAVRIAELRPRIEVDVPTPDLGAEAERLNAGDAAASNLTRKRLIAENWALYRVAKEKGELSAARACLSDIARLNGYYELRPEQEAGEVDVDGLTDQDIERLHARLIHSA